MTEESSKFTSDRRRPHECSWRTADDWGAGTAKNVNLTEDGLTGRSSVNSGTALNGGIYYDFESGSLPPAVKGEGTIVNSISTQSRFGNYSWRSDSGGRDDMAYVEIDGNAHEELYFEAWWKNPLDTRVDFFETHSEGDTITYDFFNDGSAYYHYDGKRRFLFNIDPTSWYRSEVYFDRPSNYFELEIYDTGNNLVASRSDSTAIVSDAPRESMIGPGSRNDVGRLFVDELFVIPEDYRGNPPVVSIP